MFNASARVARAAVIALLFATALPLRAVSQRATVDTAAAVRTAREVFQEVERGAASHRWIRRDTTIACADEPSDTDVSVQRDRRGIVRLLQWRGGSDDHAETHRYFYDASGRQRFAFETLGAVNGTHREERVYFDGEGTVVRRLVRILTGPGYTALPETGVADPEAWLAAVCRGTG